MSTPHEMLMRTTGSSFVRKGYDHRRRMVWREIGDAMQS